MYRIKLYDHVPKPDPAESGRIVAAHYYPSWTKGANTLTKEFEDIAAYPERTPLMGYYQDTDPEVIDWEIKWALEHGINCFIFCWYRKKENLGKPMTTHDLRLGDCLHNAFFTARYATMMKFAIMFETQARWAAADREDLLHNVLPFWVKEYFSRDNYLKIDNQPVVFLYDTGRQFRDALGGDGGMKEAFDACREEAKKHGYNGLIFAEQMTPWKEDPIPCAKARGIDAVFAYNWGIPGANTPSDVVHDEQMSENMKYLAEDPTHYISAVSQFWDPEPRFFTISGYHKRYFYLDYKTYRRLLRNTKYLCDAAPRDSLAHKIIMVDNWNEWDEGHYLAPNYRFGFKYLQCIREELTDRENVPDYRMPASLGFGPYDEAWGGQQLDLSAHNDRKLDEGDFTHHRYLDFGKGE